MIAPRSTKPRCRCGGSATVRHSRLKTRLRVQRRYRCAGCGRTWSANAGTPYHRLRHGPGTFDRVIAMSIEGMSKAAIARVMGISWSTVSRWIERAATYARAFDDRMVRHVRAVELQADELRTFTRSKKEVTWAYTSVEVWSRLWTTLLVGNRTLRNTRLHFRDMRDRCLQHGARPLITSDAFAYNRQAVRKVFGPRCIYVQVEKTIRSGRLIRTRHELVVGQQWRLEHALSESEDSRKVNTSYVERLNLTIRRSIAALQRKTTAHARSPRKLEELLVLLRCYYNFVRPHGSLKFGRERRTPAMQAGLVKRRLSLRDIFLSKALSTRRMRQPGRSWGVERTGSRDRGMPRLRCEASCVLDGVAA